MATKAEKAESTAEREAREIPRTVQGSLQAIMHSMKKQKDAEREAFHESIDTAFKVCYDVYAMMAEQETIISITSKETNELLSKIDTITDNLSVARKGLRQEEEISLLFKTEPNLKKLAGDLDTALALCARDLHEFGIGIRSGEWDHRNVGHVVANLWRQFAVFHELVQTHVIPYLNAAKIKTKLPKYGKACLNQVRTVWAALT